MKQAALAVCLFGFVGSAPPVFGFFGVPPEKIADYYLDVVLPKQAAKDGIAFDMRAEERAKLRQMIIEYESIRIEPDDAVKYMGEDLRENYGEEDVEWLKNKVAELKSRSLFSSGSIAVTAVQEWQRYDARRKGYRSADFVTPKGNIDARIRDAKFVEMYPEYRLTREQAGEIATDGASAKAYLERGHLIYYMTGSHAAMKRGWVRYHSMRNTIREKLSVW